MTERLLEAGKVLMLSKTEGIYDCRADGKKASATTLESAIEEVTDQRTKATTGPHQRVEVLGTHDCNGLTMVTCRDCKTTAHAIDELHAKANLAKVACSPDCANCKALRDSYQEQPALPAGAEDYDGLLHVCPHDGNRWWQSNRHFHLWQQVTDDGEWETVQGWLRSGNY